jgi:hypothetical protein
MTADSFSSQKPISRREFLFYMWAAGAGLLTFGAGGAALWAATPRSEPPEISHVLTLDPKSLPLPGSEPVGFPVGKFWISNTERGLLALSMYCTHRQFWLYKWVPANDRFECPACGSKFSKNGNKIIGEGPARRNLDRFPIYAVMPSGGYVHTSTEGDPLDIRGAVKIVVDARKAILGKPIA